MRKSKGVKEADIQKAIRDYLKAKGIQHIKQNMGAKMVKGGIWGKNENKGFPDIFGTLPDTGRMFAIEVKVPGAKLLPEQEQWRRKLIYDWLAIYVLATSVEDVKRMLELYESQKVAS